MMYGFNRSEYTTPIGDRVKVTWWQWGSKIFRHRQRINTMRG